MVRIAFDDFHLLDIQDVHLLSNERARRGIWQQSLLIQNFHFMIVFCATVAYEAQTSDIRLRVCNNQPANCMKTFVFVDCVSSLSYKM